MDLIVPADGMAEPVREAEPVVRSPEDVLAFVPALDHKQRDAGREEAGLSGHPTSIAAIRLNSASAK
jgi:hypothetical protein